MLCLWCVKNLHIDIYRYKSLIKKSLLKSDSQGYVFNLNRSCQINIFLNMKVTILRDDNCNCNWPFSATFCLLLALLPPPDIICSSMVGFFLLFALCDGEEEPLSRLSKALVAFWLGITSSPNTVDAFVRVLWFLGVVVVVFGEFFWLSSSSLSPVCRWFFWKYITWPISLTSYDPVGAWKKI